MIPANAIASSLQAHAKPVEAPLIQAVDALQEIQKLFTVGEQVRAQVAGLLTNGRFAVLVKDQLLDLNLPRNTEEGETFNMRVLANSPRLTFLLPRLQTNATFPPLPQQALPDSSSNVDISGTARFLGGLITETAAEHAEGPAMARLQPTMQPLLPEGAKVVDTTKLGQALKQALSEGGLFYESHLAEWAEGSRSLSQLLAEPQARFGVQASIMQEARREPRPKVIGMAENDSNQASDIEQSEVPRSRSTSQAGQSEGAFSDLENMPVAARQLIQQQLQLLDQRQLVWEGFAWQGQPLRWEVEEDGGSNGGEDTEVEKVWRTRLLLTLPHLGQVEMAISLHGQNHVEVGFRVKQSDTASLIRDAKSRLQLQFEAAGLTLDANQVLIDEDEQ